MSEVPLLADFAISTMSICSEVFQWIGRLGIGTCLCSHDKVAHDKVIELMIACEGHIIGMGNADADGSVKLYNEDIFHWDGNSGEQANDIFFILTELFKSVWIGK